MNTTSTFAVASFSKEVTWHQLPNRVLTFCVSETRKCWDSVVWASCREETNVLWLYVCFYLQFVLLFILLARTDFWDLPMCCFCSCVRLQNILQAVKKIFKRNTQIFFIVHKLSNVRKHRLIFKYEEHKKWISYNQIDIIIWLVMMMLLIGLLKINRLSISMQTFECSLKWEAYAQIEL